MRSIGSFRGSTTGIAMGILLTLLASRAPAQTFEVREFPYQPLVLGSAYEFNDRGDLLESTPHISNMWRQDPGVLAGFEHTLTPHRELLSSINDAGDIAGIGTDATAPFVAIWRYADPTHIGRPKDPAGGFDSVPTALMIANGPRVAARSPHGSWTWNGYEFTWLLTPELAEGEPREYNAVAQAINSAGAVAGFTINQDAQRIPAIWIDGNGRLLPIPTGYTSATPVGINLSRRIIGTAHGPAGTLGVLWESDGTMVSLGVDAVPFQINDRSEIIGTRPHNGLPEFVLWRNTVPSPLQDLITDGDYHVLSVEDINDRGEILIFALHRPSGRTVLASLLPVRDDHTDRPFPPSSIVPILSKKFQGSFDGSELHTNARNGKRSKLSFRIAGSSPQSRVRLYADDRLIGERRGAFGIFTLTTDGKTVLDEGTYVLSIAQSVNGIESTRRVAMTLRVDRTAPSTPDAPLLHSVTDSGAADDDGVTSTRAITFTGLAEPGATIRLRADGKARGDSTRTDATGNWSITVNAKRGTHRYRALAIDPAGNMSEPSDPALITFKKKRLARPYRLSIAEFDHDPIEHTSQAPATPNAFPTIRGIGIRGASVRLVVDGLDAGSADVGDDKRWAVQITRPLDMGTHRVIAEQTDIAGNTSRASKPLDIRVTDSLNDPPDVGEDRHLADVNIDGLIDEDDLREIAPWLEAELFPARMDLNGDGIVDASDVDLIVQAINDIRQ